MDFDNEEEKDEEILFERTVIDETLIREAVRTDLLTLHDPSTCPQADELDLQEVSSLLLSFQNIYKIDNMEGFENLTKLQLDNNRIQKIQNLDHLVNLEWLDLSFNQITTIENLDTLVNLKDLSLFNNQITKIENLDALKKLNVLSLGNNQIENLDYIKDLRQFKNLRLLNLKGNKVCDDADYHNTVFAYLTGLKYLDYTLIEPYQFQKARDAKLETVLDLDERDLIETQENKEKEQQDQKLKKLAEANLRGLDTFFNDMIGDDSEYPKVKLLPGFGKILGEYRTELDKTLQGFCDFFLEKHGKKTKEIQIFNSVLLKVRTSAEQQSIEKIEALDAFKKKTFKRYDAIIEQESQDMDSNNYRNNNHSYNRQFNQDYYDPAASAAGNACLDELKNKINTMSDELMDIEMLLVEQVEDITKVFEQTYGNFITENCTKISDTFRDLLDIAAQYGSALRALVDALLKEKAKKEEDAAAGIDVPDDDHEVAALLGDKEAITNAVQISMENHVTKIQDKEDEVTSREKALSVELINKVRKAEVGRNRHRVSEIYSLMQRYIKMIADKIETSIDKFM